jgi:HK97 family phage prohead protease
MDMKTHIDVPFEKAALEEDGTFKGVASPFGGKADSYGDVIAPGAFSETLKKGGRNGTGVAMLWQHEAHEPIGVWTNLEETGKGLEVQGKLTLGVRRADDTYKLLKAGALKGLSIGYDFFRDKNRKPVKDSFEEREDGTTLLKKLNLWEISPVTFPAQVRARITRVKSLEDAQTERDFEEALRDLGVSKKEALVIMSKVKTGFEGFKPKEDDTKKNTPKVIAPVVDKITTEDNSKELKTILEALRQSNADLDIQNAIIFDNQIQEKRVIPFRHYPLADEETPWDGPKERRDADVEKLRMMSTWVDPENMDIKAGYKLPHHRASDLYTIWRGVRAAMAALFGARGGVDIPSDERRGVYNHLARHYREFDKTPPTFS